jgi:SAM-dependent methyltransferase
VDRIAAHEHAPLHHQHPPWPAPYSRDVRKRSDLVSRARVAASSDRFWVSDRYMIKAECGRCQALVTVRVFPVCAGLLGHTVILVRRGGSFYDEPEVIRRFAGKRRGSALDPTHVMEEPAVLAELGDVRGRRVIDLGCGDGAFGRTLLAAGAASYLGVDGSRTMVERARQQLTHGPGQVVLGDLEDFTAPTNSADLVICRLALHYVADIGPVLDAVAGCLRPGGRFVMTVVHPVITAHDNRPEGPRTSWIVDHYFELGPRTRPWMGSHIVWHHRTVEHHVQALLVAGLTLGALRECEPVPDRCAGELAELDRRRRVPLFLLLRGDKPASPP